MITHKWEECPHYHGRLDSVGVCDFNEMRFCQLEAEGKTCEVLREIREQEMKRDD